jgi:transposase
VVSKIDWQKAYQWFIADARRSYADVAEEFGVSKQSVERNARATTEQGELVTWAKRRQLLGENAKKQAEDEYKKSVPARNEQHLLQYRNLQIIISTKVSYIASQSKIHETDASQLLSLAKALKIAIDGERAILGLATSVAAIKPDTDDTQGGWGELLALAMKTVEESV